MKYLGSKSKLAKYLIPFMEQDLAKARTYIEPFCGGCNMIDKIKHRDRIAADGNPYLMAMWNALKKGWIPPDTITKEQYEWIKANRANNYFAKHFIGFIGHNCSFSGDWFAGYAGTNEPDRNRCLEAKNNLLKQMEFLQDVRFYTHNYKYWDHPMFIQGNLFYCDPPYYEGLEYRGSRWKFDHREFWKWCRETANKGAVIYVSDYYAPDDFELLWEMEITINAHQTQSKTKTEKLYRIGKLR